MAQHTACRLLDENDRFPRMELQCLDGVTRGVPDAANPRPVLLSIYRGLWCGVCRQHLVELRSVAREMMDAGALVIAASVDPQDQAREMAEMLDLTFPLAFGLDVLKVAEQTGAFYNAKEGYLHASCFVLQADGQVLSAVYANGARGRFTAHEWRTLGNRALYGE